VIEPFGEAAFRLSLPERADARSVRDALLAVPGALEVVVAERHALVTFAPERVPSGLEAALEHALATPAGAAAVKHHVVRVRYDGPDLPRVASLASLSEQEVIALHTQREYVVRLVGFLPGFAYLGETDPKLAVPRLPSPRARVPAGAVGLAGGRTGIYPCASPGGWNLIGTAVGFTPFDPERGAALALGDQVRFEPA
jgi:UPF0271 protein